MKKLLIVLSIMALATLNVGPALAGGGHGSDGPRQPTDSEKKAAARQAREDEKAYKNALDRIPVSTKKQDPWDKMR
jgi:hypothetical protein